MKRKAIVRKDVISYGSQEDTVKWFIDTVSFPRDEDDHDIDNSDGEDEEEDDQDIAMNNQNRICLKRSIHKHLPVASVVKRTGTSNYNIVGVGYNFNPQYKRFDFQLMSPCYFEYRKLTFSAHNNRGNLILGGETHPTPQFLFVWSMSQQHNLFMV